jgi:hypothetical protein
VPTAEILAFLEGLVERPYSMGARRTPSGNYAVRVTNTGTSLLRFQETACRLDGPNAGDFRITDCPLSELAAGQSAEVTVALDPASDRPGQAILEVHPVDEAPSGVDLIYP